MSMNVAIYAAPASLDGLRRRSLVAGIAGLVVAGTGAFMNPGQFFHSYLLAFLFWLGAALGGLVLTMLHHTTGGKWGVVLRRIFEAAAGTIPWMALLFVPIVFGMSHLYPWIDADVMAADHLLQEKALYLNGPFFVARAALYFAIWVGLAFFLSTWSAQQDRTGDASLTKRMTGLSAAGLVLYAFTMTFAAIDWGMSLDPHWFSTMYGFLFMIGQAIMGLSIAIIVAKRLSGEAPMAAVFNDGHWHDLGKLLFAFAMVWTYLTFSQFLIIWSANLPEEIPWYMRRISHGWQYLAIGLVVFHFLVPFVVLMSRRTKRNSTVLAWMAMWMIVARLLDVFFLIGPDASAGSLTIHWIDVAALVGLGGIWLALFTSNLMGRALLPVRDPELASALKAES